MGQSNAQPPRPEPHRPQPGRWQAGTESDPAWMRPGRNQIGSGLDASRPEPNRRQPGRVQAATDLVLGWTHPVRNRFGSGLDAPRLALIRFRPGSDQAGADVVPAWTVEHWLGPFTPETYRRTNTPPGPNVIHTDRHPDSTTVHWSLPPARWLGPPRTARPHMQS